MDGNHVQADPRQAVASTLPPLFGGNVQAEFIRRNFDISAEPLRNKVNKRIVRKYAAAEISELLASGRVTLKNCVSSKGNKYSAVFELDDTGKYVNLNLVEFIVGKKNGK